MRPEKARSGLIMFIESPFAVIPALPFIITVICSVVFFIIPVNKDIKRAQRYPLFYMFSGAVILYSIILNYGGSGYHIIAKTAIPYTLVAVFVILVCHILALVEIIRKRKSVSSFSELSLADIDPKVSFIYADLLGKLNDNNVDDRSYLKRVRAVILPFTCIGFMVFMFGVYELYFSNITEFKFIFVDILPGSIIFFAASVLLSFVTAFVLKGKNLDRFAVTLGSVCVLAYVQYAFLNGNTFITGEKLSTPDWIVHLNLLLWIGFPVVMCILSEKKFGRDIFIKGAMATAAFLIVIQGAALPVLLSSGLSDNQSRTHSGYSLDGSEQFEISSEGNVIVFIMDTYHNDYFSEYIEKYPDSYEKYSDFIFFENVNSEVGATTLSMPHLLTATPIDYSIPIMESNANAWKSENAELFYGSMQNAGYSVRLYTDSEIYCGGVDNMLGKIDNVKEFEFTYTTEKTPTYLAFVSLALYRYSPHFLKELFYLSDIRYINQYTTSDSPYNQNTTSWKDITASSESRGIAYYNDDYYDGLENGLSVTDDKKLCIFQHIHGMHDPYISDEGEVQGYLAALNGCMKIFDEYIEQLKKAGAYENSTIILTADHGLHTMYETSPVMLVKPAGRSSDRLEINTAPGNLQSDLLPTILDCSGLSYGKMEYSLLDIDEDMKRTRVYRNTILDLSYPRVPKADSYGYSVVNSCNEYSYTSHVSEFCEENSTMTKYPITDYWW